VLAPELIARASAAARQRVLRVAADENQPAALLKVTANPEPRTFPRHRSIRSIDS
jgi:hypothetical protein